MVKRAWQGLKIAAKVSRAVGFGDEKGMVRPAFHVLAARSYNNDQANNAANASRAPAMPSRREDFGQSF